MNMLNSFIKNHLSTAKKYEELSKSIITYSGEDKIFVIGLGNSNGIITEQKKAEILKQSNPVQQVYFFTLFETREVFQKYIDMIASGSYVWIASEPEHTIHFDDKATITARQYN
jgi:BsuBI/PstI restriction endonuclease domain